MTPTVYVFDARPCLLGEGALWHPVRRQLFWFDILAGRLLARDRDRELSWDFGECVSAAGWVDGSRLLVASETALWQFDIESGDRSKVAPLEADDPATRSNDGRADRRGGFWIGTMGKDAEPGRGAIYRFLDGRVERLFGDVTIPNAICFSPDGETAYFADTAAAVIRSVALDAEGWPVGEPRTILDLSREGLSPDGAVVDADGFLWCAHWGAGRVVRYRADGARDRVIELPATNTSCPAFGGKDLATLYVTSARVDLDPPAEADGRVYAIEGAGRGLPEPAVRLRP
jgi:sugar lactone lactonase YvrE